MYSKEDSQAHWLSMVTGSPFAWAQMGFWDGRDPYGAERTSVVLYSERSETAVCQSYLFNPINPPPYNPDYPMIYWTGQTSYCGPEGRTGYQYWVGRMGGAALDTVYLPAALNNFQAFSEQQIRLWMEPNGTQQFGHTIGLSLYNKDGGYWSAWDTNRPTHVVENEQNSHYWHNPVWNWWEFTTTSTGW
ncbi:MAG TPA: hypothetical protein VLS25_06040 [Dehalococcoidia bacterium]|nr:hypothetical protein [Dehalococcoidia bacterium]